MKNFLLICRALHPSIIFLVLISTIFFYLGIYQAHIGRYFVIACLALLFYAIIKSQEFSEDIPDKLIIFLMWFAVSFACFRFEIVSSLVSLVFGSFFIMKLVSATQKAFVIFNNSISDCDSSGGHINTLFVRGAGSWMKREAIKAALFSVNPEGYISAKKDYQELHFRLFSFFSLRGLKKFFSLYFWTTITI